MSVQLKVVIDIVGQNQTGAVFNAVATAAEGLATKIVAISTAWQAFGNQLTALLGTPFAKAVAAETATNRLAAALRTTGQGGAVATRELMAYADQLSRVTGFSARDIEAVERRGILLGMTKEQTEGLAEASALLAKATGIDLTEAENQLIGSLRGQARQLAVNIGGLDNLTMAQLRQGAAIAVVQERLKGFASIDAPTTAGAWQRIRLAIERMNEETGNAIVKGLNLGTMQAGVVTGIDRITDAIRRNAPAIERLVDAMARLAAKIVDELVPATVRALDKLDPLFAMLGKFDDLATLSQTPVRMIAKANYSIVESITGAITELFDDTAASTHDAMERGAANQRMWRDEIAKTKSAWNALAGAAQQGPAGGLPQSFTSPDSKPTVPKTAKFGGFAGLGVDPNANERLTLQRQISDMLLIEETRLTSDVLAEHAHRMDKILEIEEKGARVGVNLSKQADQLRLFSARQLTQALAEEQFKRAEDGRKRWFDERKQVADAMGEVGQSVRIGYAQQEEALADFQRKGLVNAAEFARRKAELAQRADFDAFAAELQRADEQRERMAARELSAALARQHINVSPAELEHSATIANDFLQAAQSGVNAIVAKIGTMYGPIGNLVAGIVQFLNQGPDEFRKMVSGLIAGIEQLPKNIIANVPSLIAEIIHSIPDLIATMVETFASAVPLIIVNTFSAIIETLPKALGMVFSAGFWGGIANSLFSALRDAFRNFWSLLFTGNALSSALGTATTAAAKKDVARFGSDDPNAGGAEFKIKDANLRSQRKATQSFEESFADAVDKGGKSFTDMLQDAFQAIFDWFRGLPKLIVDGMLALRDDIMKLGGMILDGMISAVDKMQTFATKLAGFIIDALGVLSVNVKAAFGALGSGIIQAFVGGLGTLFSLPYWGQMGAAIWQGLVLLVTNVGQALAAFGPLGALIWHGFVDAVIGLAGIVDPLYQIGKLIVDGLVRALGNIGSVLAMLGHQIVDGLIDMLTSKPGNFAAMGGSIVTGFVTGLANVRDWIGAFGSNIYHGFVDSLAAARDWITGFGVNIYHGLVDSLATARDWIAGFGVNIYHGLVDSLATARSWIGAFGKNIFDGFYDALAPMGNWIKGFGTEIWNGLSAGLTAGVSGFVSVGTSIFDGLKAGLDRAVDWLKGIGGWMYQGLVDGLYAARDWIKSLFTINGGGVTTALGLPPVHRYWGGAVGASDENPARAMVWAAAGVPRLAGGGMIDGPPGGDVIPALLRRGEVVKTPEQMKAEQGGTVINLSFNVATGAVFDRDAIREAMPQIIQSLNRSSRNGTVVVRRNGIA